MRLHKGAGKPWAKQDYSKGSCKLQVLETALLRGQCLVVCQGCKKHPRTCPDSVNMVVQDHTTQT